VGVAEEGEWESECEWWVMERGQECKLGSGRVSVSEAGREGGMAVPECEQEGECEQRECKT